MMLSRQNKQTFKAPDGVEISYTLKRSQEAVCTLVMLHGLASNQTRWSEFVTTTKLTKYMHLLRLDLRGHGKSMTHGRFDHSIWQQDLQGILRQEALDKIIIVGHSMGAQLAIHYAVSNPSQVLGLVLIDPTLPEKLKSWLAVARRLRYLLWVGILLLVLFNKIKSEQKRYPYRDLHELDKKTRKVIKGESSDVIAQLYTSPNEDLKYMPLVNYLQDVYSSTTPLPDISKIKCPVCVLLSKASSVVDTGNIKDYFSAIAKLEIKEIDANHWPLTEKPDETRRVIEECCLRWLSIETTGY